MPADDTYVPLFSTTLGSAQASVTFSSIPSGYTDLVLIYNGSSVSNTQSLDVRVNSDSGSNYSLTALYGDGTSATSFRLSNYTYGRVANFGTTRGTAIAQFMNYSNTTTNKTWISRSNDSSADVIAFVNLWRSTAAITSITLQNIGGGLNIAAGSTFALYGILAA